MIQRGLPRDQAIPPAPEVPGWSPSFRGPDDPRVADLVAWIESLYGTPPENYGLSFSPTADANASPPPAPAPAPATP